MNKEALQKYFNNDFTTMSDFEEKVMSFIFGDLYEKELTHKSLVQSGDYELKDNDCIKDILQCAQINSLDANEIVYVYEVILADNTNVSRNRVNILRCIKSILETYSHALVVFHYENTKDAEWRFTYVHKGRNQREATTAKRYTYLCGKTHPSHTVAKNFLTLKDSDYSDEAYEKAFSESELSKEFYSRLFDWYEWAMSLCYFPEDSEVQEPSENKLIRLITRLMFVWFIKQKELIPENLFDVSYLKAVLKNFDPLSDKNGNYYNAILQNLFFATLNREIIDEEGKKRSFAKVQGTRDDKNLYRYAEMFSISENEIIKLFDTVPFLNGGLFECLDREKSTHHQKIHYDGFSRNDEKKNGKYLHRAFIPNCVFFDSEKGIISLLKEFNFTVEESSPMDVQVSLDPELLGNVFENLLGVWNPETQETVRASTGSFYTPREIVQYMVDQSLVSFLKEKGISEYEKIEEFFTTDNEEMLSELSKSQRESIIKTLLKVKILDPACGSGAFPVGCLNRMVELICALDNSTDTYKLKTDIIANNLYGIDIQTFAVQITKLRFFISLICEQEIDRSKENFGINTLPNLETRFVAANTLVGIENDLVGEFDTELKDKFAELIKVRKEHVFNSKRNMKKELILKDEKLSSELIDILRNRSVKIDFKQIEELKNSINTTKELIENGNEHFVKKEVDLFGEEIEVEVDSKSELKKKLKKMENILNKLLNPEISSNIQQIEYIANWSPYEQNFPSPFFDSYWMFGLINNPEKKPFDIIIANPPYIDSENMKNQGQTDFREYLKNRYNLSGNWDIYIAFFEFALKYSDIVSFITPDKWLSRDFGLDLRKNRVRTRLSRIVHAGADVFESARVDAIITLFEKESDILHTYIYQNKNTLVHVNSASINNLPEPYLIDYLFTKNNSFIVTMDSLKTKFTDLGVECEGSCATHDPYELDPLIQNKKQFDSEKFFKIVNTGTISKFHSRWGEKEMTHFGQKTLYPVVNRDKFSKTLGKTYVARSKSKKLIFKSINLLDVLIDLKAEIVPYKSTLVVCSKDTKLLKLLCGILNTRLIFNYFRVKYASSSYCGAVAFTKDMINYLPIPEFTEDDKEKIISLVDKMIKAKEKDSDSNINDDLEGLNLLVYELYGFTDPKEIAMIEFKEKKAKSKK